MADDPHAPSLLVSYPYLPAFERNRHRYCFRDWALDSGAWSAHNSGARVDAAAYAETCRRLLGSDPRLTEVFSLDVIGDWRAGLRNTEALWAVGVPAVPAYHPGEPWSVLTGLARDYPKVALGGVVSWTHRRKAAWVGQCFARVWPAKVHGFGMASEPLLNAFPFHSTDATTWETAACRFGRWEGYGYLRVKGSGQNLRAQVEHYLGLERRARSRWRAALETLGGFAAAPTVRLAVDASSGGTNRPALALTPPHERGGVPVSSGVGAPDPVPGGDR